MTDQTMSEFRSNGKLKRKIFMDALLAYNLVTTSEYDMGFQSGRVQAFLNIFDRFNEQWEEEERFRNWITRACETFLKIGIDRKSVV